MLFTIEATPEGTVASCGMGSYVLHSQTPLERPDAYERTWTPIGDSFWPDNDEHFFWGLLWGALDAYEDARNITLT